MPRIAASWRSAFCALQRRSHVAAYQRQSARTMNSLVSRSHRRPPPGPSLRPLHRRPHQIARHTRQFHLERHGCNTRRGRRSIQRHIFRSTLAPGGGIYHPNCAYAFKSPISGTPTPQAPPCTDGTHPSCIDLGRNAGSARGGVACRGSPDRTPLLKQATPTGLRPARLVQLC